MAVLEELYTNKNFPNGAMKLTKSLKESGKSRCLEETLKGCVDWIFISMNLTFSRADLWAYAGKVAVEFTTEQNNFQCAGMPSNWMAPGRYNYGSLTAANAGMMYDCLTRRYGEADCEVGTKHKV